MKNFIEFYGAFSAFLLVVTAIILLVMFTDPPKPIIHEPTALVTKDGCTIYKWYDKGERMYYTKCDDGTSPTISR